MEASNPFSMCYTEALSCGDQDPSLHFDQLFSLSSMQNNPPTTTNASSNSRMSDICSGEDSSQMGFCDLELEAPFCDVITDDELASLNIKDLNRKLKEKGLCKDTIERLKQRRRTLKNRKYATDCRDKKDTEVQSLEVAKDYESGSISDLVQRNESMREKLSSLKTHYARVMEFASKNNIPLRQRNVPLSGVFADATETF